MVQLVLDAIPPLILKELKENGRFAWPNFMTFVTETKFPGTKAEVLLCKSFAKASKCHSDFVKIVEPTCSFKRKWVVDSQWMKNTSPTVIPLPDDQQPRVDDGDLPISIGQDGAVLPIASPENHENPRASWTPSSSSGVSES
eukprot:7351846-Pyramimonas_sp.AAC.1